jgi:predicted glutamine amidotransferase
MCRFLAYKGDPVLLEEHICSPAHSLVHQSLHAEEAKTVTNGDGFGVGWYGERNEPGIYREVRPAWSDENLRSLCAQVRSSVFFAHVRASTGTATARANCHPFGYDRYLFMHNGQIGGYHLLRRKIELLIPDALYHLRSGTSDSEAIFLAAIANGLEQDPLRAMACTLQQVRDLMKVEKITEPLRFTAALTDGLNLWAFRWACDSEPPSLYYKQSETGLLIVSEPIDGQKEGWKTVPTNCTLIAKTGQSLTTRCLDQAMRDIAA